MKTFIGILFSLFIILQASFAQNDDIRRHIVRAETALKMGLLPEAIAEYKSAISLDPNNGSLYYNLAVVQEKTGEAASLKEAIKNYNKYLELNPQCSDREFVENKIFAIEFQIDAQNKNIQQAENLKGTWRSDWHISETGLPFWFLNFDLVDTDLRITVEERSALYRNDFTYKTVTLPYDKNSISFMFTNDTKHAAENNDMEHAMLDILGSQNSSVSALSPLMHGLINSSATQAYQSLCTYIFKLKISQDSIYGTVHIIEKRIDATSNKVIQDQVQYISFNKNSESYPAMTKEELKDKKVEEKKKSGMTTSLSFDYAIAQGNAASKNIMDKKSGFMTEGFGMNLLFSTRPFFSSDSLEFKKMKKFHVGFTGTDGLHVYVIKAPYELEVIEGNQYVATHVERVPYAGITKGCVLEISCAFGATAYWNASRDCFFDFTILPLGFSFDALIGGPEMEDNPGLGLGYHCLLGTGVNFLTKSGKAHGMFVNYTLGPVNLFTSKKEGHNANIYAIEDPSMNLTFLHVGYKYSF